MLVKPTIHLLKKMTRVICPLCKELQMKIFPYCAFELPPTPYPACVKCVNKENIKQANIQNEGKKS